MRTVYIDNYFVCHATPAEGRRAVETERFDHIPDAMWPYYFFVPSGEVKVNEDGQAIKGEFIQCFDTKNADAAYFSSEIEKQREVMDKAGAMLTDKQAVGVPELYRTWENGTAYAVADRRRYGSVLYSCLQDHISQDDWTPDVSPSLWAKVLVPDPDVFPEWQQPDSTNAYKKGDKVTHIGKTWVSDLDNNVWEPGVYGWTEVIN